MGTQSNAAPVIIKRKKIVGGGGHHGGAWKVAYADFVTAMMAFFMLMWLLNATTEKQRKGLADYFSPTIAINRVSGGGDGSYGGDSVFVEDVLPQNGTGASSLRPAESHQARGNAGLSDSGQQLDDSGSNLQEARMREVEDILKGRAGESDTMAEALRHVVTRVTDEGLVIELFDLNDATLFRNETDEPDPVLPLIAQVLVDVFRLVENRVAIEGHVRAQPIVRTTNTTWPLSTARADRLRTLLIDNDMEPERVRRITGHADQEPVNENPLSARNNRIEVILLREEGGR